MSLVKRTADGRLCCGGCGETVRAEYKAQDPAPCGCAWNTQEKVAELTGVERSNVSKVLDNVKNGNLAIFHKDFTPFLYNVWKTPKRDNERDIFGAFPEVFMENLLYYHTEPLDGREARA